MLLVLEPVPWLGSSSTEVTLVSYETGVNMLVLTVTLAAMFPSPLRSLRRHSRGFALLQEDAGERELERGLHHLHRQRLELQRELVLGRRGAGVTLHVHVHRGQNLPVAFSLLGVGAKAYQFVIGSH